MKNSLTQFILGYKTIHFNEKEKEKILNFMHGNKISSWGYSSAEGESSINIALSDYSYFFEMASLQGLKFDSSSCKGIPHLFEKYKKRIGVWTGLSLFCFIMLISSLFVWDVRIVGNVSMAKNEILTGLQECGLHAGSFIPSIKSTELCNEYLSKNKNIAWMTINPKGSVIYVEIIENEEMTKENKTPKYANVVASEDAIVEEISVSKGNQITQKGKTVKAGDLLISGVYASPRRYSFVHADGIVLGKVERDLEIEIPYLQHVKNHKNPKISEISVNFFGFLINIFRYSGKMPAKYDTIYKSDRVVLFDRIQLPVYVNVKKYTEYQDDVISISQQQAIDIAFSRLSAELAAVMQDGDLVSKKIEGQLTDTSYVLKCNAVCIKNIATHLEFEAD